MFCLIMWPKFMGMKNMFFIISLGFYEDKSLSIQIVALWRVMFWHNHDDVIKWKHFPS